MYGTVALYYILDSERIEQSVLKEAKDPRQSVEATWATALQKK